jgi:phosphoribosylaminoimidazolecarboxamide formyltransferase / IMP cyclohydrolase
MRQALISVYDKTGLVSFAKRLIERNFEIISTGKTYDHLQQAGIMCKRIDEVTGFIDIFEGRVKTLHPLIHGGLLGKRDDLTHINEATHHHISWIDLLVVNLYPFSETKANDQATDDEIIEMIDIGGPAMLRSAAKNHRFVTVIYDIRDYDLVLDQMDDQGEVPLELKRDLAAKAFRLSASYDAEIASYLTKDPFPETLTLSFQKKATLRYGENPHQKASFYTSKTIVPYAVSSSTQLHGKALSYNNIQDAEAALMILRAFDGHTAVAVKHMNPCGIGSAQNIHEAFEKAYDADPISIFGGIVALSDQVDLLMAERLHDLFLEVILAPDYEEAALTVLKRKKNLRVIRYEQGDPIDAKALMGVSGGVLIQDQDQSLVDTMSVVTKVEPSESDIVELLFAFQAVKFVKSNAIVITKNHQTIGIGAGQMSRIAAANIAFEQAGEKAHAAYLASDAFIPMTDTIEMAIKNGIKAIIQPGGSIKDQAAIDLCDEHGIIMVMTAMRHFRH